MGLRWLGLAALIWLTPFAPARADPPAGARYYQLLREADDLYAAGGYAAAGPLYRQLAEGDAHDPEVLFRLGLSLYRSGDFPKAALAWQRAYALGGRFQQRTAAWLARAYARAGAPDGAISWLNRALHTERFENRDELVADDAFARLRADPAFIALTQKSARPPASRTEGWRGDLDYLVSEVKRLNIRYSRERLPPAFTQAAASIRARIPQLSDAAIVIEMQRMLATLGQTHTALWPGQGAGRVVFRQLPLTFYAFPEGVYVIDAWDGHEGLIGARVAAFDGAPARQALAAVGKLLSHENEMEVEWLGPTLLAGPTSLHVAGVAKHEDEVTLSVVDHARHDVQLGASVMRPPRKLFASRLADAPAPPLYLSRVDDNYWLQPLDETTLYVQFNQVVNAPGESLAQFALRLRGYLAAHAATANLIVDLRHNNGGDSYLYPELVETLVAFDAQPGHRLFALIGRGTFSAAGNFALDLERFSHVVFAGEPTSARPRTYGDESPITLPYSGVEGGLSAVYWQLTSPRDDRPWIAPRIPVALTAADYFANRDPVLEAVREVIGAGR